MAPAQQPVQRQPARARGRRATMRDVAAAAGVSLKTVSRVVNEESGVSAALAERVRVVVAELDFRPDAGASNLRRADRRTGTVALLLQDVSNPWSSTVQRAVEDVAARRGVLVLSASTDEDPVRERELTRALGSRRVDGIVLAPTGGDQGDLAAAAGPGAVLVCVDRAAVGLVADSVVTTNTEGARDGVRHLLNHGHRRVAHLGDDLRIATAVQRHEGYLQAHAAARLPADPRLAVHGLRSAAAAREAVSRLLTGPAPPTALFTAQNLITVGALHAVRDLGLQRSVALVGFDDVALAELLVPGLTVVAQDPAAIGRRAAEVLFERLDGATGPPRRHVVPTELVLRGTGEIPPPTAPPAW